MEFQLLLTERGLKQRQQIYKHLHCKCQRLEKAIIGLSFDTTAFSNCMISGACICLENALGNNLLWLACQRQIHELILRHVFEGCNGPSTGPDILYSRHFSSNPQSLILPDYLYLYINTQLSSTWCAPWSTPGFHTLHIDGYRGSICSALKIFFVIFLFLSILAPQKNKLLHNRSTL